MMIWIFVKKIPYTCRDCVRAEGVWCEADTIRQSYWLPS